MLSLVAGQFTRFVVVGLLSTAVNYTVFYVLLNYWGLSYLFASATGFIAGVLVGFRLNRDWTYGAERGVRAHLPRYLALYLISLMVGILCLAFFVEICSLSPEFGNVLSIGITTVINFVGTKTIVFRT